MLGARFWDSVVLFFFKLFGLQLPEFSGNFPGSSETEAERPAVFISIGAFFGLFQLLKSKEADLARPGSCSFFRGVLVLLGGAH